MAAADDAGMLPLLSISPVRADNEIYSQPKQSVNLLKSTPVRIDTNESPTKNDNLRFSQEEKAFRQHIKIEYSHKTMAAKPLHMANARKAPTNSLMQRTQ